jgi:RimJ/RimL family protein N-acetyltransferase
MYGLSVEHWGRGLGTEACTAAIAYLWRTTSYQRVFARTDPPNERSVRVIVRLGMTLESTTNAMMTYVLRRPT